ncbi:MAG: tRNA (N6-isopentenyl adenosine(37)-C2)-methylthiotransferase MiaB [Chloroflexi bacterium]|nr:tRNA (N6-isopentenyl adenosine(37)-C2)-methylthiotransferase MiaB [Chloroflexota bacterium]
MHRFYIWTVGCQMNEADSERLGGELERLGFIEAPDEDSADVIVLNSCVVRQGAEDRVASKLGALRKLKARRPEVVVGLMGCMVGGPRVESDLRRRFPHVDVFMRPQVFEPLFQIIARRNAEAATDAIAVYAESGYYPPPPTPRGPTAFVPVIKGCDEMCTYCIVPFRRGRQGSRPLDEIAFEVNALARAGIKEITLLGQTVDAYGLDRTDNGDLADLLVRLSEIEGLARMRFLTSHPRFMSQKLLDAVARLSKACEHINVPVQAGHDEILRAMRRTYTVAEYRDLIDRIRSTIPDAAISTDVIVGFPGETAAHFEGTYRLLAEVQFDVVHVAMYSPRPGTFAFRKLADDVPAEEKKRRLHLVEELQAGIAERINAPLVGRTVEVLVEEEVKGKWRGRTRTNKLVFFEDPADLTGQFVDVRIERASPWSLQGAMVQGLRSSVQGLGAEGPSAGLKVQGSGARVVIPMLNGETPLVER